MLRIAFGCQSRVGKDYACEYLQKKYGGVILHFSDPLYEILHNAQSVCGFPKEKDTKFLQYIGTNWAREKNPSVWIDILKSKVPENQHCFVADLRFENEFTALKQLGFSCMKVIRPDRPIDRDVNHPSETGLLHINSWHHIINNDSTIENFEKKLDDLF